jgi:PmbA protein
MDGDGFGFAHSSGTSVPKDLFRIGEQAACLAKEMRGSLKIPGGDYTVVIRPEAMDGLLDVLLPSLSGDWKRRGISRLVQGQAIFDPRFNLSEDGLAKGAGIRPFDDEGRPSKHRPLIEGGRVSSFMHDLECAALAGAKEEGYCERNGFDSPPGIGPSNLVIDEGDRKDMSDLGRYLEVYSMHGSHTANATSGDAGFEVSTAFLVEDSHRTPVRGLMMSCNVFDMFKGIEAIGGSSFTLGSLTTPLIAFGGIRIVS